MILLSGILLLVSVYSCMDEHAADVSVKRSPVPILPQEPFSYANDPNIATLGRVLFYDNMLSANYSVACASCHKQHLGFADNKPFSIGFADKLTERNSMSFVNLRSEGGFFWDMREQSLTNMSTMPVLNHIEMGFDKLDIVLDRINNTSYYQELFKKAFNTEKATTENVQQALATFLLSIRSFETKLDKQMSGANLFNAPEQRGYELFTEKLMCSHCHREPEFSNRWGAGVANIGLDLVYKDKGITDKNIFLDDRLIEINSEGIFKIPSLRNVELTAPYMHDGRFATLEEVIDHYSNGVKNHPNLNWELKAKRNAEGRLEMTNEPVKWNLTNQEKQDLIAFLRTLTDPVVVGDIKFSDPFLIPN